jgi:uncharacterized membrane protein YphA (DoxX/SURF4 family)
VVGSIALFLGVLTGCAALSLIPILLGAIAPVHLPMAFFLSNPHGGWEFSAFAAVALVDRALRSNGALTQPVRPAGVAALRALLRRASAKRVDVAAFGRRLKRCRYR